MAMSGVRDRQPRLLLLVAVLNLAILVLTAGYQIYDTNFYTLWESTALLAGDHPYRDFFEWGAPLDALSSLVGQVLAGNRLIGEFVVQWAGIVAGAVISFHLGLRASRSIAASLVMLALTLAILGTTATYHYPKLLVYPLGLWVIWRYMDRPGPRRAALVGAVTVAAFLFRHDHGVYVAAAAAVGFVLTRLVRPFSRDVRAAFLESAVSAATAVALLLPWLVLVATSEGLREYVEARSERYAVGSPYSNPYLSLLSMNPMRTVTPEKPPPPKAGVVSFEWEGHVDAATRDRLARECGLRLVRGPGADGRWEYETDNVFDRRLLGLDGFVNDTSGLDWGQLRSLRWPLPPRADAVMWLQQVALLVPILLLFSAGFDAWRSRHGSEPVRGEAYGVLVGAALLAVVDWRLFREPGYVVAVAPLTAALAARLVAAPGGTEGLPLWRRLRAAVVLAMLLVTAVATVVFARSTDIFTPWRLASGAPEVFAELTASPPIDGFAPREEVFGLDPSTWSEHDVDAVRVMMRYMHDCTAPGDRVLVTGQTPFQVGYYADRPIAGGQLYWHERWRSDPKREQQSLELLQRQSVPFAYSTHDPVLDDFKPYPGIRAYLMEHYVELEGSRGLLLIDKRRQPTGRFGTLGFPCFAGPPRGGV